jgi:transcriptional regulator with XRE-family HTH domain
MPYDMDRIDKLTAQGLVELGAAVRRIRREHYMSQRVAARRADVGQATISRLERGLAPGLPLWRYARILTSFSISVDEIQDLRLRKVEHPSPLWTLLHGSFGIGGRLRQRVIETRAQRNEETRVRLEASMHARGSPTDADIFRPRLERAQSTREARLARGGAGTRNE